jgi:alkaline phosphatase
MPVSGSQSTSPDDEATVTDSAAAASAWATGETTSNGTVSVTVDGTALPTLGTEARAAGRATGLVTTASVTDASPAAFFSNSPDRDRQGDIAEQYLEDTGPDVILGGGEDRWQEGDLISRAEDLGYAYVTDAGGLAAADGDRLLGLFAGEEMFRARPEGDGDQYAPDVPLPDMTAKALEILSRDPDGFFLFVEEEAIDGMSHANNGTRLLQAMRVLEDTVRVAREFVAAHPDTLLIVTGDHETGGLTVEDVGGGDSDIDGPFPVAEGGGEFVLDWSTSEHTGVPTPVTAEGPGSLQLSGSYPNTHLHTVMQQALTG